ncbi:MAG: polyprenyl synthetase family protein [Chitinophagales bacterium]|nr:polyprenyl synthetase family protein [Chitinophagales bacterium]
MELKQIKSPIAEELEIFEEKFKQSMKSRVPLLDRVTYYIVQRKGKQMRPMFVLLSAKLHGPITEKSYNAAALVELLHTASLVHDDVVDNSFQRRGFFSINALWKNKIAVLVGDFLLSKGLLLSLDNDHVDLLHIMAQSVKEMSEGELLQLEKARRLDIEESIYFEIIRQKTATLISSACACGAASTTDDKAKIAHMRLFGEKVGIAFQIKDDLFDYGSHEIGKPKGIDIKERKMTLPLIYALGKASRSDKRRLINIVKNHNEEPRRVDEVIQYVRDSGGIEYTENIMQRYKEEAINLLHTYPRNEIRDSLEEMIVYTTERKV